MERPFKSFLALDMENFIARKKAENSWSNTYYENLHYFDNYIHSHYPTSTELTQVVQATFHRKGELLSIPHYSHMEFCILSS